MSEDTKVVLVILLNPIVISMPCGQSVKSWKECPDHHDRTSTLSLNVLKGSERHIEVDIEAYSGLCSLHNLREIFFSLVIVETF